MYQEIIFLISPPKKKKCCGYSLEALCRDTSDEYQQRMFLCRNKTNVNVLIIFCCKKKLGISSSDELGQILGQVNPSPAEPGYILPLQTV